MFFQHFFYLKYHMKQTVKWFSYQDHNGTENKKIMLIQNVIFVLFYSKFIFLNKLMNSPCSTFCYMKSSLYRQGFHLEKTFCVKITCPSKLFRRNKQIIILIITSKIIKINIIFNIETFYIMLTGQTFQNAIVFSFKKSFHVNECTVNFLSGTNKGLKKTSG